MFSNGKRLPLYNEICSCPFFLLLDIGKGYRRQQLSQKNKKPLSLTQCFTWCKGVRKQYGKLYNGIYYHKPTKQCSCIKGDKGHVNHKSYFHYRFEDSSNLLETVKSVNSRLANSMYLLF